MSPGQNWLDIILVDKVFFYLKKISEYDQEIPQSQIADKPMQGRATHQSLDTRKTN